MDGNESDMDGSMSNAEEEEEMRESDFDEDIESEANGALRLKMEAMDDEILSRIRKSEREDRDEFERDYKAHNEKLQREVAAAVQRHAAQAVAAAVAAGLPNPTQWASSLPPSVTSPGPLPLSLNNGASVNSSSGINIAPNTSSFISSSSPGGGSGSSGPTSSSSSTGVAQHLEAGKGYTFEEQFKQLYELSDDPKRKEFLDDLFAFMQKRGTPVNRIPIMAKQVLDLFELYRLVVARGGLVEVINKKIWREITKGLNLPSSITSAAFTLRTQYMKYLYQYECEKEHLSSTDELQQAIDGNRREGRRSSYGHYSDMVGATPPPASNVVSRNHTSSHHTSPISLVSRHINGHGSQGASSGEEDNTSMSSTINPLLSLSSQSEALNLEVKPNTNNNTSSNLINNLTNNNNRDSINHHDNSGMDLSARTLEMGVPGAKRYLSDGERFLLNAGVPSAHIKLTSRDGRTQMENSLVLSMEINNILYQGVLFARNRMS